MIPVPRDTSADPGPAGHDAARDPATRTWLLGLSYAEAAAVEGVPVGTISSRVARTRDELIDAVDNALAG
ncbi:sigma factor-like helix-turn-helix DNA-binding protein [Micromonospora sp. NPDC093277]|uniref:sigma factor-like helix-turn-helix DNA-binding protein n=1 Tax=Micromonospora sp. NPDC093277 TaxID=3364291 RepID=UPI00382E421A